MNHDDQRIAIAEFCGWEHMVTIPAPWWANWRCDNKFRKEIPDYLNDLLAMADAEKMLTEKERAKYRNYLLDRLQTNWGFATAAQRAEAFLRTIEKWEDAP